MTDAYQKAHFLEILSSIPAEELPHLQHVFSIAQTISADAASSSSAASKIIPFAEISISHQSPTLGTTLKTYYDSIQQTDAANIQYTSGSTGLPKPATLTHRGILNNGYFVGRGMDYQHGRDKVCIPVPLYHCFGTVLGTLCALSHGVPVVFPSPGFDEKKVLASVTRHGCTSLYGVPTMFLKVLHELEATTKVTPSSSAGAAESASRQGVEAQQPAYNISTLRTGH